MPPPAYVRCRSVPALTHQVDDDSGMPTKLVGFDERERELAATVCSACMP